MLGDLCHDGIVTVGDLNGGQQLGKLVVRETDIQNRAHDLDHGSDMLSHRIHLL